MSSKKFWWCWLCLVGIAVVLRFVLLGRVPVSLYWDEAAMYLDVKSVLQSGQDMFGRPWYQVIYPSYGDFKQAGYIWSAELAGKLFGLSEWSLRLPSALAGVGTVVVAGLVARWSWVGKVKDLKKISSSQLKEAQLIQLATMVVVTISPWSMMFSRTAFEGHLAQFLFAVSIACVVRSRWNWRWMMLAPVWAALATYTYFSVRFVWPGVFILSSGMVWWWQARPLTPSNFKATFKPFIFNTLRQIILPLICFGLLLIPLFKSPLYKDANTFRLSTDSVLSDSTLVLKSNVYRELAGNTRFERVIFNQKWLMTRELLRHYSDNLSLNFLFVTGDPNLRHGTTQHGLFLLIFLPGFILGWYAVWQRDRVLFLVLLSWWLLALLPASIPNNTPHALRSLNALVPLSIVIGIGCVRFWQMNPLIKISKHFSRFGQSLWRTVLLGAVLFSTTSFLFFYFMVYPKLSAADWQDGYKELTQYMYAPLREGNRYYVADFDDRFYIWLMAYGPFTATDFHSWQSQKYQFKNFENVTFGLPSDDLVGQASFSILLPTRMREEVLKTYGVPNHEETVTGASGLDRFRIFTYRL